MKLYQKNPILKSYLIYTVLSIQDLYQTLKNNKICCRYIDPCVLQKTPCDENLQLVRIKFKNSQTIVWKKGNDLANRCSRPGLQQHSPIKVCFLKADMNS